MAKIPTFALMLAVCLLLDVKYLTLASSTTVHESNNASQPTAETLGQGIMAVTQHHGSSTAGTTKERPGNSDTSDTSNELNTTLTTRSQGSVGFLSTAQPTKNGIDNVTVSARDGNTPLGTTTSKMTSIKTPETTEKTKTDPKSGNKLRNAIIILCVVVGVIVISFLYCFFQRRKRERNSFNLHSASPDNAAIPLSSGVAEKNAALQEDKIDIHPIEPPENTSEKGDSPKKAAASDPADGHEGESNSTASTVPKDDEADKLSLDSSRASLLPAGTGNLKEQDGKAAPPAETHIEELNENNNNSSQWAILQLKRGGRADELYPNPPASSVTTRNHRECLSEMERATLMQADFEEDQGRGTGDFAKKSSFYDILLNLEP